VDHGICNHAVPKKVRGASAPAVQQSSTPSSKVVGSLGGRVFKLLRIGV